MAWSSCCARSAACERAACGGFGAGRAGVLADESEVSVSATAGAPSTLVLLLLDIASNCGLRLLTSFVGSEVAHLLPRVGKTRKPFLLASALLPL